MQADEIGVNRETIRQILVEDLGKRKVASRFVPHALSDVFSTKKTSLKLLVKIRISWIRL